MPSDKVQYFAGGSHKVPNKAGFLKIALVLLFGSSLMLLQGNARAMDLEVAQMTGQQSSKEKSTLVPLAFGNVAIVGSTAYTISNTNHTATLTVNQIINSTGNTSGSLSLRLFVTAAPIVGAFTYWTVGQQSLAVLSPGFVYNSLNQTVPLLSVPDGIYYIHLGIFEFGAGCTGTSDGFCLDDNRTFPTQVQVVSGVYTSYTPPPPYTGVVSLVGSSSYTISNTNQTVTAAVDQVANGSSVFTSGSLSLRLFVTTTPITGAFSYWTVGKQSLNPLPPNNVYNNLSGTVPLLSVPDGIYYIHLGIFEYYSSCASTDGYCVDDFQTYPNRVQVTGGAFTLYSPVPTTERVIEYHHASFDHYFITPVAAEIALLDARQPPFQDWTRTGYSFNVYVPATAPAGSVSICRFFNNHFAPKSSHFYAAHGFGCEDTIRLFPDWGLEDDKLFNTMLPNASGICQAGTFPVYRVYNQGMGAAPNHRFVTSLALQQTMVNLGYAAEGVVACVPP